ncbi:MAG TPA: Hpt domain-containing protein [Burkholderiales bacterium]|nr:Hpt domain-containing protein [Burkholderiales bacterium]
MSPSAFIVAGPMTAFLSERNSASTVLVAHASQAEAEHVGIWLAENGWHSKAMMAGDDAIEESLRGQYAALVLAVRGAEDFLRADLLRSAGFMRPIFGLASPGLEITQTGSFDELFPLPLQLEALSDRLRRRLADSSIESEFAADAEFHNSEIFARLRHSFLAGLADCITAIENAFAAKDWENAGHLVHALKGTAASFGFPRLAQSSRQIEDLLRTDRKPAAEISLQELRSQTSFLVS